MSLASQVSLLATRIGQEIKAVKAFSIARANHTGTQLAATVSDFNAAAVTANAATSTADRARANHTGTQLAATISDFATAADARITAAGLTPDSVARYYQSEMLTSIGS